MRRRLLGLVTVVALTAMTAGVLTPAGAAAALDKPGAPGRPTAAGLDHSARISWPAPANGGAPITIYLVTPYLGSRALATRAFHSKKTSEVVSGLANGKAYSFKVAAHNAVGTGPDSTASTAVTTGVPSAPSGLTVAPGSMQATVSWRAPSGHGHAITGYVITPYLGTFALPPHTFRSTATVEVVTGLIDLTSYAFSVAARNSVGTGPQSAPAGPVRPTSAPALSLMTVTNQSGPASVSQSVIVDAYGHPLYMYGPDGTGSISKAGANLGLWPVVVWSGTPTVGTALEASKAAVYVQPDGTRQLSYNGHLLYTFLYDFTPGTATGDGETSFYLLDDNGNQS